MICKKIIQLQFHIYVQVIVINYSLHNAGNLMESQSFNILVCFLFINSNFGVYLISGNISLN